MPPDRGLFLAETWRLAPSICRFTSELFYEGRLKPHAGLERQKLTSGQTNRRTPDSGSFRLNITGIRTAPTKK